MQYFTEQRFRKRAAAITLISCTALQVIAAVMNYVYEYAVRGNSAFGIWGNVISTAAGFIGGAAVFSGYAAVVYFVFLYGLAGGGEWTVALIAGVALNSFLISFIGSVTYGIVTAPVAAAVVMTVFLIWTKGCRGIQTIIFASCLIPYIGATAILFATTVVSAESLTVNLIYAFINLGTDFIVLTVIARLANLIRTRAIRKDGGNTDISIGGNILPHGNPVLKTLLVADVLYFAVSAAGKLVDTIATLREYGAPVNRNEWFTLLSPYLTLVVWLVAGYAVMVFVATRFEKAFMLSQDEGNAAASAGRK